jgi:ATP-dependent exoDNAse (exonuclease V) beta subunit
MAYGKREHTLHAFRRRLDEVLAAERERTKPPPPAISQEHAALREQIADAYSALLDPEEPESTDVVKRVMDHPDELASAAVQVLGMMLREQDLLIRNRGA